MKKTVQNYFLEKLNDSIRSMKKYRIFVVAIGGLAELITLFQPWLLGGLIDTLGNDLTHTIKLGCIMLLLIGVSFFLNWMQNFHWFRMIHQGTAKIRSTMFSLLLIQPFHTFEKKEKGDILARVLDDASLYAQQKLISLPMVILNGIRILIVLGFLFIIEWKTASMVLVLSLMFFLAYLRLNKKLRITGKAEREAYSSVLNSAQEILGGMETIQKFQKESYFSNRFAHQAQQYYKNMTKLQYWKSLGQSSVDMLTQAAPVLAIVVTAVFLFYGQTTIGAVISIYAFLPYLWEPLRNLTDVNIAKQQAKVVEQRLIDLFDTDEISKLEIKPQLLKPVFSGIECIIFDHVSYSYDSIHEVIHDLSFKIQKGQRIAITGPSGSGKSTLIKLLIGELSPVTGSISINGLPMKKGEKTSFLNFFSIMPQNIFLFQGSIIENIAFGDNFSEKDIQKSISLSSLTQLQEQKEIVNSNIFSLSGGEKQRVGLARTLIRHPDFLILDEPTSALDQKTEKNIVQNLERYLKESNTTMITISHRPEILRICDFMLELHPDGSWSYSALEKNTNLY